MIDDQKESDLRPHLFASTAHVCPPLPDHYHVTPHFSPRPPSRDPPLRAGTPPQLPSSYPPSHLFRHKQTHVSKTPTRYLYCIIERSPLLSPPKARRGSSENERATQPALLATQPRGRDSAPRLRLTRQNPRVKEKEAFYGYG